MKQMISDRMMMEVDDYCIICGFMFEMRMEPGWRQITALNSLNVIASDQSGAERDGSEILEAADGKNN